MEFDQTIVGLSIKVANNRPKRSQPIEERHNVWCHNCKCQGHLANKCPTPKGFIA